jgi:CRISPR-associated Csx3 family protein
MDMPEISQEIRQNCHRLPYQHLNIKIPAGKDLQPDCLQQITLPRSLTADYGIVLEGVAPNWFYCHLVDRIMAQYTNIPWVGCYAMNAQGAVVIATQTAELGVGHVVAVELNPSHLE